jgi:uncharacterized membrane protein
MSLLPTRVADALALAATIGSGVVGGVLFGFSAFVMDALDRLPADRSIEAMQSINRRAPTAGFMIAMVGTAVLAVVVGADAAARTGERSGGLALAGALLFLASTAITARFHVPLNDRLAGVMTPHGAAEQVWRDYARPWTTGNHVRAALAIAAATCFGLSAAAS